MLYGFDGLPPPMSRRRSTLLSQNLDPLSTVEERIRQMAANPLNATKERVDQVMIKGSSSASPATYKDNHLNERLSPSPNPEASVATSVPVTRPKDQFFLPIGLSPSNSKLDQLFMDGKGRTPEVTEVVSDDHTSQIVEIES